MFNPKTAPYADYYLQRIRAAAPRFEVKVTAAPVADGPDIERAIIQLGRAQDGGLVVMIDSFMFVHRKAIIALAAAHKLPAMYYYSAPFVEEGGLIGYGFDVADIFRRAAPFVDRILRGVKPADLPVEQPTKFGLAVNLKTAKALGLTIPQSILLRADKVIE